jgi:putative redox protein
MPFQSAFFNRSAANAASQEILMIKASMHEQRYQTVVSSPINSLVVDTTKNDWGGTSGFKPHELLEAALAACVNLTLRISAERLGIPIAGLTTFVEMDGADSRQTDFSVQVEIDGELSEAQRQQLMKTTRLCPVSKILSAPISISYART